MDVRWFRGYCLEEWCEVFRNSAQPQYRVTFDVDVTNFLSQIKKKNYSFTFSFVYAVTKCANEIEEFRFRFVEGKPAIFDTINTSFTYLNKETEFFKAVNVPMQEKNRRLCCVSQKNRGKSDSVFYWAYGKRHLPVFAFPLGVIYPYFPYGFREKDNAVPLFDWGKFYEKGERIWMPFSVQVHHSFADGIHIGKLAEKLRNYLNEFE